MGCRRGHPADLIPALSESSLRDEPGIATPVEKCRCQELGLPRGYAPRGAFLYVLRCRVRAHLLPRSRTLGEAVSCCEERAHPTIAFALQPVVRRRLLWRHSSLSARARPEPRRTNGFA